MVDKIILPELPNWENLESDFKSILESKNLTTNKWTEITESKIREIHNCKYALLTNSGTNALFLLLKSINYEFERVYMQDFTWNSTKILVESLYPGKVEYVDVDKDTWLSQEPNIKGGLFIPTMTLGNTKSYNYPNTVYDSAHCGGLPICNGRGLGEIISFSPAKNITAAEGGALITNNEETYNKAKTLRRYIGRIPEFNARILFENLNNCSFTLEKKKEIYKTYKSKLDKKYKLQEIPENSTYNELLCIVNGNRDETVQRLKEDFEIRFRYEPSSKNTKISNFIYKNSFIIPSSVSHDINKYIEKLNKIAKDG